MAESFGLQLFNFLYVQTRITNIHANSGAFRIIILLMMIMAQLSIYVLRKGILHVRGAEPRFCCVVVILYDNVGSNGAGMFITRNR